MAFLTRSLFVSLLLPVAAAPATEAPTWLGDADCRIAPLLPRSVDNAVSWSGGCKDGHAEGKGVLEWRTQHSGKRRVEATLVRGEIAGEATLHYDGGKYIGPFKQGMPHGAGYFSSARDGSRYEGDVVDGRREGTGVQVALDGSSYQGQWQANKRHGIGKAVYTLGGSYEGEWRDNRFHGQGRIVYGGSGRTYTGEFVEGRPVGAAPAHAGDYERFGLKDDHPATAFAPMDATWQELTPEQQTRVRSNYPALDDADEPPYPLDGRRAFHEKVAKLYRQFTDYRGDALVHVTVDADGKPTSVSTYGVKHAKFARALSSIALLQRFKPAMCAGAPCAMLYPIRLHFTVQ